MPMTDPDRIFQQMQSTRIVSLWRALQPLQSVVSFMNTGAHPDDETSSMLAALGYRDGLTLSYACANRGEGGQNDIGTEATHDLGVVRTAEMERAADVLNLRLYWLSEHPDDDIFDFGFSKSGVETLEKWGHPRTLKRFVEIVRTEKPDIICPTFLDIPGQHGHHRAMTQAAHEVVIAAADPDFPNVALPVWQVKKMYLPAWSGAGDAYDDDVPPPSATLTVNADGNDPITGWSWAQIGQQSRAYHKTQGMGRWVPYGAPNQWSLHLARTFLEGPDDTLISGLPANLQELIGFAGADEIATELEQAHTACVAAIDAFPNFHAVLQSATAALKAIRIAYQHCSEAAKPEVLHRLLLKEEQLSHVIRIAADVDLKAALESDQLRPGETVKIDYQTKGQGNPDIVIKAETILAEGWTSNDNMMSVSRHAHVSDPYPARYIPGNATAPAVRLLLTHDGITSQTNMPFETPPLVLPEKSAEISPDKFLLNTASSGRSVTVAVSKAHPANASTALDLPEGWSASQTDTGFDVVAPDGVEPGLYEIPLLIDGEQASTVHDFRYDHVSPRIRAVPAKLSIRVVEATLPDVTIGYIGGGNDRVGHWLGAMGCRVIDIAKGDLTSSGLAMLDTLVVGIFAMRTRPELQTAMPLIHRWVENGGHLVTLYHRPWDAWDPDKTPPRQLEIGKPSLRWRVTDENAEVTHLLPDHPLLNVPNKITARDWENWHKERGLYFAKSWSSEYRPLLSMADPDEDPHLGSLLSARIGYGRHTHTSLILHHQMEKLTAGAFRIMANLLAKT